MKPANQEAISMLKDLVQRIGKNGIGSARSTHSLDHALLWIQETQYCHRSNADCRGTFEAIRLP